MAAIFFWVLMLLALAGNIFWHRGNTGLLGTGVLVWLLFLLVGLHVFPFKL